MMEKASPRIASPLMHSLFYTVLFPPESQNHRGKQDEHLTLRQVKRFSPSPMTILRQVPLVVVDVETTGLDPKADQIIEIGAIKMINFKPVAEFSSFISTSIVLSDDIIRLTGITPEMLEDQPPLETVMADFLKFIEGSLLVAHNAEFDASMIKAACSQMGVDLEWPYLCTLKLARELLPDLENKKLDTLAQYYGLTFESRHRAIGDIKVTCGVLREMLAQEAHSIHTWGEAKPFSIET